MRFRTDLGFPLIAPASALRAQVLHLDLTARGLGELEMRALVRLLQKGRVLRTLLLGQNPFPPAAVRGPAAPDPLSTCMGSGRNARRKLLQAAGQCAARSRKGPPVRPCSRFH